MISKFESKSPRVKGLAFHPFRSWIAASLHTGTIQLIDYRVGTVVDKFDEHEGPVRGVDFHATSTLLVSGGDDYKIKVWDYKLRRCLFTLLGHLDYIRTVQFHPSEANPWILSASDDQTIRIWNWKQRNCMSVLTGHNHYVMCASFHPKEDLVVSASLDQTVRVWDTSGLRKKMELEITSHSHSHSHSNSHHNNNNNKNSNSTSLTLNSMGSMSAAGLNMQAELFGTNDVIVKYVLEGHDRGVNWASFHSTLPLLVSAADDRQVKLWRMSETKAWEVDTMRGHTNNVSCVLFHPRNELIVSNSEDRSIRVWDMSKRVGVQTFRRENDRFWIMAAHKEQNLLAAGHDGGMIVFKLERERPALALSAPTGKLYFVRGRELVCHDYATQREIPVANLRRPGQYAQTDGIGNSARYLSYNNYNPNEGNVLVSSDVDGGNYELITFGLGANHNSGSINDGKRGSCVGPAVWIARNRFAVLDKSRQIVIKNMDNETTKKVVPPTPTVDMLFNGGAAGRILLRSEDKLILFEQQSRRVLGEISAPKLKQVVWTSDGSKIALICKYGVILCDRNLEQLASLSESVRVKSGAWDSTSNIFLFTTLNHIKYALTNGDVGIIRTLDSPVYVTRVHKKQLFCLDREGKNRIIQIDTTEAVFKLALENKRYAQVMEMVKNSRLCGQAIIKYLQAKGFPEVALHFVREPKTRFNLALACGNIEAAMETAFQIESEDGSSDCWHQLGVEALRQGNHQVVEMAYQRTKDFDRLSFLYLLTGNTDKLRKMAKISDMRGDVNGSYQNALFLGDAAERIKVLENSGNVNLAFYHAKIHGLDEDAERLKALLEASETEIPTINSANLLQPPTPIIRADNWPVLAVKKTTLEDMDTGGGGTGGGSYDDGEDDFISGDNYADANNNAHADTNWGDDDEDLGDLKGDDDDDDLFGDDGGGDGGWDDELDLGDDDAGVNVSAENNQPAETINSDGGFFQMPKAGKPASTFWVNNSSAAADHAAAGSVETAMQLLNRQIAAKNFDQLKSQFLAAYLGAHTSLPGMSLSSAMVVDLQRNDKNGDPGSNGLPARVFTLQSAATTLKQAYRFFQAGKFADASASFSDILKQIPMITVDNKNEANEIKEMLEVAREYITAIRIKAVASDDPKRSSELAAFLTHCNMQPAHLLLVLRSAMVTCFKHKNFILAASFSRRLLELPDINSQKNAELKSKAGKVLNKAESMGKNEHEVNYDPNTPFVIDCKEFLPIYKSRGESCVQCAFCQSNYGLACKGILCLTCGLSEVGASTIGLVTGV